MRTVETKLFKFEELTESAKRKAITESHDINTDYEWYQYIFEDYEERETGFEIENIYFSGFYSQGDGAMFTGKIKKDIVNFISPSYKSSEYKRDWNRVVNLIKKGNINIFGIFKHSGRYYHHKSYTSHLEYEFIDKNERYNYLNIESILEDIIDDIERYYEDLCLKIYNSLFITYEDITSDNAIEETLIVNEFEFTEDGSRF